MPQSGTNSTQSAVIKGSNVRITQLSPTGGILPGAMTYTLTANVTYTMQSIGTWSVTMPKGVIPKLPKGKPGWNAKFQARCAECGRFAVPSKTARMMLDCERCRGIVSRWVQ